MTYSSFLLQRQRPAYASAKATPEPEREPQQGAYFGPLLNIIMAMAHALAAKQQKPVTLTFKEQLTHA